MVATPVRVRAGVVVAMVAAAVAVPRAVAAVCAAAAAAAAVASVAVRSVTHRDCFSLCSLFLDFQKSSCEKWRNVRERKNRREKREKREISLKNTQKKTITKETKGNE